MLTVYQVDAVVFSSGIQHIFDFTKPETVDVSSKRTISSNVGAMSVLMSRPSVPEITDEFNTNYVAIVNLILLFLPHFLKLNVSPHVPVALRVRRS